MSTPLSNNSSAVSGVMAKAAGGVLSVGNDQVQAQFLTQIGQDPADCPPSRLPDNVSNHQDSQLGFLALCPCADLSVFTVKRFRAIDCGT